MTPMETRRPALVAIIDDDEAVRVGTASLIRSVGLKTATFSSAEDYLQSPLRPASDCVITDVQMPGMGGLGLQTALRALGSTVPFIFITAFPEENIRRQVEEGGAVGFFAKPFDGEAMISCLKAALGGTA
ncbi:Response regulator receiver domain-containing protein [Kaistia soli DSM 19436]|uniref:Response regulator receiver domain-containing protein n=1 Tax=Kaistia soli DSM 19436 TaxID=1122133 RepID=A0A1M5DK21_9HYPH|nr:response regulator [Kaistia soli]SHF67349.1 Response regulator receiver domain-containing protein [Kaistia soli DSM 19436]